MKSGTDTEFPAEGLPAVAGREPRWEQVRRFLITNLETGIWKPGEVIPSEMELSRRLGVAPGTVRRAADALVRDGMLCREQGRGTFVGTFGTGGYVNRHHRFYADALSRVVRFEMRPVLFETVPASVAQVPSAALNLPYDSLLLHAVRLFASEGKNVGISELWLDSRRFAGLTEQRLICHPGSLYTCFETYCGVRIVNVRDRIKAVLMTPELAELGNFPAGQPCLEVTRVGYTFSDTAVEYRRDICLSADYHIEI